LGFQPPERLEDWVDHDAANPSALPCFSKSYCQFLLEAAMLARAKTRPPTGSSLSSGLKRTYVNLRYAALRRGLRLGGLDQKVIQFARRALRRTA
jgi:hypothetical protein